MNTIFKFTFLFIIIFSFDLGAQCPTGEVVFSNQADVDAFKDQWPNCTELNKLRLIGEEKLSNLPGFSHIFSLSIGHDYMEASDPLLDMTAFSNTNINSIFLFKAPSLNTKGLEHLVTLDTLSIYDNAVSLEGLKNLQEITKEFWVLRGNSYSGNFAIKDSTNINLPNLLAINNLKIVGPRIKLIKFPKLNSFSGIFTLESINANSIDKFDKIQSIQGIMAYGVTNFSILQNLEIINGTFAFEDAINPIQGKIELIGFNKLKIIEGDFILKGLPHFLDSLSGFKNLEKIGGDFIFGPVKVSSIPDFESLKFINGKLRLVLSYRIPDLKSFSHLESIGGDLFLNGFQKLRDLKGFDRITSIGGQLSIQQCDSLESLHGLENLIFANDLVVEYNKNLKDCSALCNLFQADGVQGIIEFNHNPTSCSSQSTIESECDDPNGFMLRTQSHIDDFISNYSATSTITGDLIIGDNEAPFTTSDISDISGLSFIKTLIGDLYIGFNNSLENLNGLENLTAITGNVTIQNNDILSKFRNNESITVGFENISQIGGDLQILENNALVSLNGLEKLSTIGGKLVVSTNANLSDCKGICNILENDGVAGSIFIIANPSGCSNKADVEQSCMSGSSDLFNNNIVLISPNPVDDYLNISSLDGGEIENVP